MPRKIASYVNERGDIISLNQRGSLVIYKKTNGIWALEKEQLFTLDQVKNIRQLRDYMTAFVTELEDCKTFIGAEVTGVPYFELEKAGVAIWEFEGRAEQFLGYVDQQEKIEVIERELDQLDRQKQLEELLPKENERGYFQVDLTKIQGSNLGITSKQILQPLIKRGQYHQLEIICSHIPPWLAGEITSQSLEGETVSLVHKLIKLIIRKRV